MLQDLGSLFVVGNGNGGGRATNNTIPIGGKARQDRTKASGRLLHRTPYACSGYCTRTGQPLPPPAVVHHYCIDASRVVYSRLPIHNNAGCTVRANAADYMAVMVGLDWTIRHRLARSLPWFPPPADQNRLPHLPDGGTDGCRSTAFGCRPANRLHACYDATRTQPHMVVAYANPVRFDVAVRKATDPRRPDVKKNVLMQPDMHHHRRYIASSMSVFYSRPNFEEVGTRYQLSDPCNRV